MLRGSSRHDGIPNNPTARERDRQRERQRQERAQMLPTEDNDITACTQDLFESPVKVEPSKEDQTTVEIKKQFGNFESVRHYILDNPQYSRRLIGVDQNIVGVANANNRNQTTSLISSSAAAHQLPNSKSNYSTGGLPNTRPPINSSSNNNIVKLPSGVISRSLINSSASVPAQVTKNPPTTAGFRSTFVPVPLKQSAPPGSIHKSPAPPPQPPTTSQALGQAVSSNNKNNQVTANIIPHSVLIPNSNNSSSTNSLNSTIQSFSSNTSAQVVNAPALPPPPAPSRSSFPLPSVVNPRKSSTLSHFNQTNNTRTLSSTFVVPNYTNTNASVSDTSSSTSRIATGCEPPNVVNNQQVVARKVEPVVARISDVKESINNSSSSDKNRDSTVTVVTKNSHSDLSDSDKIRKSNSVTTINKSSHSDLSDEVNKKPALQLEIVDSQIELESMLKEMMDVKTPITAIQTPGPNDTPNKKFPQRRSSKGEDIVQSLRESGMTSIPSPIKKMDSSGDSSSSYESDSDSDSEDSSSGSQADKTENVPVQPITTNSPTRNSWALTSFITKGTISANNASIKEATDTILPKENTSAETSIFTPDSGISPGEIAPKADSVSSTSVFGKSLSSSSIEITTNAPNKPSTRIPESRPDNYTPAKPSPPPLTIPTKGTSIASVKTKGASLSESSSENENEPQPPTKDVAAKPVLPEEKRGPAAKKRRKSLTSPEVKAPTPPALPDSKNKGKKGQDRNKNDTLRNVFRIKNAKTNSPTSIETENPTKSSPSGTAGKGKSSSTKGKGKANPKTPPAATSNRVSGKDSGKKNLNKSNTSQPTVSMAHNGKIESSSSLKVASTGKKKEAPKKAAAPAPAPTPKKLQKIQALPRSSTPSTSMLPPPAVVRIKDEVKPSLPFLSQSSLICRIPLSKLSKRPRLSAALSTHVGVPIKSEKSGSSNVLSKKDDISRVVLHDTPRVGSSSDQIGDLKRPAGPAKEVAAQNLDKSKKQGGKRSKRISSSQKKVKLKPDVKMEDDSGMPEVSSNVPGYSTTFDSGLVSTTKNPATEMDVYAPDSSVNPPHQQSPVVLPQPVYVSYFDKINHGEEEELLEQDAYLVTAKRLKHKADKEECGSFSQVFTYLESGLYFILTGIALEKERPLPSKEAFTMYKDTLHLIRYIGNRKFIADSSAESKIMILGIRTQALLSLKLFKMKAKETKEIAEVLSNHFHKTSPLLDIVHSPQLSTPSPRSPTSSPASSFLTGLTPSPHHPPQNHQYPTLSRNLYAQMFKQCTNTMNLIQAHDLWETADIYVHRTHTEDFFIAIDRIYGPLTLHSSLQDLVRYVKHGIKVLKELTDTS